MDPFSQLPVCPSCKGTLADTAPIGAELVCPHCGAAFVHRVPFGRYILERNLGTGGMGSVYLARDPAARRDVAVKLLHHPDAPLFLETLQREAKILRSLRHPNIVEPYDSGQQDAFLYLATEYLEGGSLDQRLLSRGLLPEPDALDVGRGIASGLQKAFASGLIHRDIKPGNILFSAAGHPKVVDFGLSMPALAPQEETGEVWGSPGYLPPERLEREPESFYSDIYSLGATLFHAVSGRPPHLEENLERVALRYQEGGEGPAPPLQSVAPHVSERTAAVIDKALARFPADRFGSYEELLDALAQAKIEYWKRAKG